MPSVYTGVTGLDSADGPSRPAEGDGREARELAAVTGVARALREVSGEMHGARDQMANGVRVLQRSGDRLDDAGDRLERAAEAMETAARDVQAVSAEVPGACARVIREEVVSSLSAPAEMAREAWERAEEIERRSDTKATAAVERLDQMAKEVAKQIRDEVNSACGRIHISILTHYAVQIACALVAIFCAWTTWGLAHP